MSNNIIKLARRFQYKLFIYASERSLNALKAEYPDLVADLNKFNRKNKYIVWLADRFLKNPTKQEAKPINECFSILLTYESKENGLAKKYKEDPEFKKIVDTDTGKTFQNLSVIDNLTATDMELIITAFNKRKEVNFNQANLNIEADRLGKVGPWNIWLPSNMENSIEIAQYDTDIDGNKMPETDWCTAKPTGSNLFYSYIGKEEGGKSMLFYVINDNPRRNEDYLSIGFIDGKPKLPCPDNEESVDRENKGLTVERLQKIWGKDYGTIMQIMQNKSDSLNGVSPAYHYVETCVKDLSKFKKMIANNSKDERREFIQNMLDNFKNIDPSIFPYLAVNKDVEIRRILSEYPSRCSLEITQLLCADKDEVVKVNVAKTLEDESLMEKLSNDESINVRETLALNENVAKYEPLVMKLIRDPKSRVRAAIVKNISQKNLYPHLLTELLKNDKKSDKLAIISGTEDQELLKQLMLDPSNEVSKAAIERIKDESVLMEIIKNSNRNFKIRLAGNTDNKAILEYLINTGDYGIMKAAVTRITDQALLTKLLKEEVSKPFTEPLYELIAETVRRSADLQSLKSIVSECDPRFKILIQRRIDILE